MNEKGFGVQGVLLFGLFAVIAIFMFYSFVSSVTSEFFSGRRTSGPENYKNVYSKYTVNSNYNITSSSYADYSDIEYNLEVAASNYPSSKYSVVSTDELVSEGLISENDLSNCKGYVTILNNPVTTEYKAYITCGSSYTTSGFKKSLLN